MRKIVIFSGAGLSAESGIPTFRDLGGLWENYRIEEVASPLGWSKNPKLVLDFYAQCFLQMQACQPNPAHHAIAKRADRFEVICITQNIDNLHRTSRGKRGMASPWQDSNPKMRVALGNSAVGCRMALQL